MRVSKAWNKQLREPLVLLSLEILNTQLSKQPELPLKLVLLGARYWIL